MTADLKSHMMLRIRQSLIFRRQSVRLHWDCVTFVRHRLLVLIPPGWTSRIPRFLKLSTMQYTTNSPPTKGSGQYKNGITILAGPVRF